MKQIPLFTFEDLQKADEEFKKLDKNTQFKRRRESHNLFNAIFMFKDDLSDFDAEYDKDGNYWSVTGYYGRSEEVVFPASYEGIPFKKIGNKFAPYNKIIKRIIIPEGYTSIGEQAFLNCRRLTEIKFPESLTSIGEEAFESCIGLTEIKFPKSLTSIEKRAFSYCIGITGIKFPESLNSIGDCAFEGCEELAEIIVDENNPVFCSVDSVMFDKAMTALVLFPNGKKGKYSIPEGIINIGADAFDDCELITSISFPQSLLSVSYIGFNGEQLTDISVHELNQNYYSIDGVLFDKESNGLLEYPRNKDKTEYAVPDGILYIDNWAFRHCKHLVNITLPESLEYIGDFAFAGCTGLKAITLPVNLQYIEEHVFEDCPNLETVTLSRKTRIRHKTFEGFKGKLVYRD